MKKRNLIRTKNKTYLSKQFERIEFLLAIILAIVLIGTLLSQSFITIPLYIISFLLLVFVTIKITDIIKRGGTIFEDYIALAAIILFTLLQIATGSTLNPIITTVMVVLILYSVGIIPWVQYIIQTKNVISFIISYAIFIVIIIFLFSGFYFANNTNFVTPVGGGINLSYEDSIYFSTITFTTVGYGDITPMGSNKLVASIEAVIGIVLNIAFIGYIFASKRFR